MGLGPREEVELGRRAPGLHPSGSAQGGTKRGQEESRHLLTNTRKALLRGLHTHTHTHLANITRRRAEGQDMY